MNLCECDAGLGNLGTPFCFPKFGIGRRRIYVPIFDSTGTRNSIDPAVDIDDAFILSRINDTDATKRWYLSPVHKNQTNERDESEFEEFEDGSKFKLRTGIRKISLIFAEQDTTFLSKLEANECVDYGEFIISDNESIMGIKGAGGLLFPIEIQATDTNWQPKLDGTIEKVMINYEYIRSIKDGDLRFISKEEFTGTFEGIQGLIDILGVSSATVALSFTMTMRLDYGSYGNEILHTGVVLADSVSLINLTTLVVLTVTNVDEVSDGVYDVAYTGVTAANDILQWTIVKEKFDYFGVASDEIVYV